MALTTDVAWYRKTFEIPPEVMTSEFTLSSWYLPPPSGSTDTSLAVTFLAIQVSHSMLPSFVIRTNATRLQYAAMRRNLNYGPMVGFYRDVRLF